MRNKKKRNIKKFLKWHLIYFEKIDKRKLIQKIIPQIYEDILGSKKLQIYFKQKNTNNNELIFILSGFLHAAFDLEHQWREQSIIYFNDLFKESKIDYYEINMFLIGALMAQNVPEVETMDLVKYVDKQFEEQQLFRTLLKEE